ncbi:MAG: hypothetical protein ACLUEK_01925 [Oscillospiraceae bacterium]
MKPRVAKAMCVVVSTSAFSTDLPCCRPRPVLADEDAGHARVDPRSRKVST